MHIAIAVCVVVVAVVVVVVVVVCICGVKLSSQLPLADLKETLGLLTSTRNQQLHHLTLEIVSVLLVKHRYNTDTDYDTPECTYTS